MTPPPPFGTFPKIHPFCKGDASLMVQREGTGFGFGRINLHSELFEGQSQLGLGLANGLKTVPLAQVIGVGERPWYWHWQNWGLQGIGPGRRLSPWWQERKAQWFDISLASMQFDI